MKFDSIGFDLDGTLWSAVAANTDGWNIVASEYGVPMKSEDDIKGVMGLNRLDLMNKLYPDMPFETQMDFFVKATDASDLILKQKGGVLYDKVESTLEKLSESAKLYIVSNCQDGYIETFLEFHRLGKYFCDYECAGTKDCSKGVLIKQVIERNGFKNSVYIGDTQGDRNAAKEAEVPFIFAEYGFGSVDSYEFKIDKFEDIPLVVQ